MKGTTYDKAMRDRAKQDRLALVTIAVEPSPLGGGMMFQGPVPAEERKEIVVFFTGFLKRRGERLNAERDAQREALAKSGYLPGEAGQQ